MGTAGATVSTAAVRTPAAPVTRTTRTEPAVAERKAGDMTPRRFTGHPISLDFQGADLRAVLRTFAEISGLNMVIDPDGEGHGRRLAARRAVGSGARHHPARQQARLLVDGTIVRIAPLEVLADEESSAASCPTSRRSPVSCTC